MTVVCFFGPDGSGKTTLAKKVVEHLSRRGHRVKYSWMRGSHTMASILSRVLSRFDFFKGEDNPYYAIRIPRRLVRLWQAIECVSVIPVVLGRYVFPNHLGFTVVADRYSIDFIVWVVMTTHDDEFSGGFAAQWAARLMGQDTILIYMTAKPEDLARRSGMSVGLISEQLHLYDYLIETHSLEVHTVETSEASIEDTFRRVMEIVNGGLE